MYICQSKQNSCDIILRTVSKSRVRAIEGTFVRGRDNGALGAERGKGDFGQTLDVHNMVSSNFLTQFFKPILIVQLVKALYKRTKFFGIW